VVATGIDAQSQTQPRPNSVSAISACAEDHAGRDPAADGGDRTVARGETSHAPAAVAPMTAHSRRRLVPRASA
jgi:hypothetical protein